MLSFNSYNVHKLGSRGGHLVDDEFDEDEAHILEPVHEDRGVGG